MSQRVEQPITFDCEGDQLVGILHRTVGPVARIAVLVVVGGPQYRVGSHRQFVLMAREIAAAGVPVLRFDYRGMGDSSGEPRTFEAIDSDIRAGVDLLMREQPSVEGVICYGLCDAASALLGYCTSDTRIAGLILANPWVRTETGQAKAFIRHYYPRRLLQRAFWKKLLAGQVDAMTAVRGAAGALWTSSGRQPGARPDSDPCYLQRMQEGLRHVSVPVLVQLSDADLTAREFQDLTESSPPWRKAVRRPNVTLETIKHADHTFSTADAFSRSTRSVLDWLMRVSPAASN